VILLDTNVISELMQREPRASVVDWLDSQEPETTYTTAITVFELEFGVRILAEGARRTALTQAVNAMIGEDFSARVLPFDLPAAREAAEVSAAQRAQGRPVEIRDVQIAGIARSRHATVATRNIRHDAGLCEVINPWDT